MRFIALGLLLLPLFLAPAPLRAQATRGSILVAVADSATGEPLPGAEVIVTGARRRATADSTGTARLIGIEPGDRLLQVRRQDRATRTVTATVTAGDTVRLRVGLAAAAIELDPLSVRAEQAPRSPRLREFYARMEASSGGYFVTREQIEARKLRHFTDAFRGIPNLQIISMGGAGYTIRMNRNVASVTDRDCPPVYYLDGVPFALAAGPRGAAGAMRIGPDPTGGSSDPTERSPDREFSLREIEGIEVYPGANVPARYGGSKARCGVILVWTRERG